MKLAPQFDWVIPVCMLILAGFGAAIIGSVAPEYLGSQLVFYVGGLVAFFLFSRIDYRIYASLSWPIYILSLVLLAITYVIGIESHGALRWIPLGPFHLQFSEILKPFLIVAFASILTNKPKENSFLNFILRCSWIILPVFLVLKQPDLGSAVVFLVAFAAMIFASGAQLSYLLSTIIPTVLSIPVFWHFLADYQKNRVFSFLNPNSDPLGASYNAIQAVIGVGSGLLFGRGLGRGTQSHLLFLPEHHTDFVFASLAEELGFVGAAIVLAVFFVLIWRIMTIVSKVADPFAKTAVLGMACLLLAQLVINIGMNIGLFPVTGITLPLVSYGGSSVLSVMITMGIIENISESLNQDAVTLHIV